MGLCIQKQTSTLAKTASVEKVLCRMGYYKPASMNNIGLCSAKILLGWIIGKIICFFFYPIWACGISSRVGEGSSLDHEKTHIQKQNEPARYVFVEPFQQDQRDSRERGERPYPQGDVPDFPVQACRRVRHLLVSLLHLLCQYRLDLQRACSLCTQLFIQWRQIFGPWISRNNREFLNITIDITLLFSRNLNMAIQKQKQNRDTYSYQQIWQKRKIFLDIKDKITEKLESQFPQQQTKPPTLKPNNQMESEQDREEEVFEGSEDSDNPKIEYDEDFKFEKKEKKYQEMSFIMGCLKNHFIFYNLSEAELENVAKKMFYCSVSMDQFIFREGSKALCFFIIEKGMMQVITNEKVKKQLRVGDGFGELALLYKAPRAASVKACETCNLWGIDRDTFRKAVEQIITQEYQENRKFMENVRFFTCLSNEHKDSIAAALITQRFSKDQIIVTEGDPGSSFYIIKEGMASLWKGNKQIKRLEKADSFGEQALFYNTIRQMTVKAEDDVVCLVLGRETLSKILGDQIFTVTFRNFMKWAFEKHFNFSKLTKNQIQQILNLMKINSYKSGSVVMKKNTENGANQKVIIVIQGALKKSKNMHPIATKSQIYGEEFLMENKPKTFDDEIVMESDGVLAEIGVDQFKGVIGDYLDKVISQNQKVLQDKLNAHRELKRNKEYPSLTQFVLIKQMRQGVFGPVLLVQHIHDKELYILKCHNKQKIEEHFVERYFLQEKSLLKQMNFSFVMELYKTYKDAKYLYSLVEFVRGEELYDVIREIGLLSTDDCQFYIGCMILILEHFYLQGIIYRDLKPQNFIVDMKGYLKLIDLGTAKMIKMKNPLQAKTYTVIGTPYYMAPQVITNKGYNFTVDLYSLGVCMYEFLCGYVPFGEKSEDPMQIYEQILNAEVKYPKFLKDKKAKKLMDQFLSKAEPENRLGGANFNSLKTHPWFESLDWEELREKRVDPPKFDRFPNCEETESQLVNYGKHARNLEDYLNEKFPNRFTGQSKPIYDSW